MKVSSDTVKLIFFYCVLSKHNRLTYDENGCTMEYTFIVVNANILILYSLIIIFTVLTLCRLVCSMTTWYRHHNVGSNEKRFLPEFKHFFCFTNLFFLQKSPLSSYSTWICYWCEKISISMWRKILFNKKFKKSYFLWRLVLVYYTEAKHSNIFQPVA